MLAWGVPALAWVGTTWAAEIGLDYWPYDHDQVNFHEVERKALPFDAIKLADIWVFYKTAPPSPEIRVGKYNLTTGLLSDTKGPLIAPDADTLSLDYAGIASANVELCRAVGTAWADLDTLSGSYYQPSDLDIGIFPPSIEVRGTPAGSCNSVSADIVSFVDGYKDGGTYTYDKFKLNNTGSCTAFESRYTYTNCSLTGNARFGCPMGEDPDTDSTVEYGYCKLFMMYEGLHYSDGPDADTDKDQNHYLILARAQEPDADWEKAVTGDYPVLADVRVRNTGPHHGSPDGEFSFAGVPDLIWDPDDDVWRMWFVSEDAGNMRYTESDDDGLTWGITSSGSSIDCFDTTAGSFNTAKCTAVAWASGAAPPEDTDTGSIVSTIDPGLVVGGNDTLYMFFAGADDRCETTAGVGEKRVILVGTHDYNGDQTSSNYWTWVDEVEADTTSSSGVLLEQHSTECENDDTTIDHDEQVFDPTPLRVGNQQYLLFFGMQPDGDSVGHMYASASGFECSDFINNSDGDTYVDFGVDPGCASPSDNTE